MRAFSDLLDRLIYTRSRNTKLRLIGDYLRETPDPDRGWALAALTGEIDLPGVKPAAVRALIEARVDPVLYRMSRDYVGDTAETVALMWPTTNTVRPERSRGTIAARGNDADQDANAAQVATGPSTALGTNGSGIKLSSVIDRLQTLGRADAPAALAEMLDASSPEERFALLKLAMGGLRAGVSSRLAKTALANAFDLDVEAVEEVWHGIAPPYTAIFDWAEGRGPQPTADDTPVFRPFMLAHPLDDTQVDLADYAAEWKWDGIRVQIVHAGGQVRLYSRGGDDITGGFPDVAAAVTLPGAFDGELLVRGDAQGGEAASFNALQQRLGRKAPSAKLQAEAPAFVRLYDVLFDGAEDLRWAGANGANGSKRSCRVLIPPASTFRR
jgi:DNA ligase 1